MKAVVYQRNRSGNNLSCTEIEKPVPQDDEILVKVMFTAINAADYRSMSLGIIPKNKIYGADIAGVVEGVGSNVRRFKVGDEVFGDISGDGFGGLAEYVAAPEEFFARKPSGVSFLAAAAVPMAAVTALQGIRDLGGVQSGQKVLICGAGGGVGNFAVQLGKHFGAHVTGECGPYNVELVRSLGAERVIDYTKEDFSANGNRYDLVLAVNGGHPISKYKKVMTPKGTLVVLGGSLYQLFTVMLFSWLLSLGSQKIRHLAAKESSGDLEYLIKLVDDGKIKVIIDRTYPLSETSQAMDYIRQGHARGKVVIQVA